MELRKKAQIELQQLERERDEARAELARVRAERDALQQQTMYDIALFGDEKLKAELAGARARLALVEPVVAWAEVVAEEAYWTDDDQAMVIDPAHMSELRHRLAALDAAPPSSEPTEPPANKGNHNSSQIVNAERVAETAEHQLGEAVEWLDHWKTSGVEPAGVDDWLDERSTGAAGTGEPGKGTL